MDDEYGVEWWEPDEHMQDLAEQADFERDDWLELHGLPRRYCAHHDEPVDGTGKCRECHWADQAFREDGHG